MGSVTPGRPFPGGSSGLLGPGSGGTLSTVSDAQLTSGLIEVGVYGIVSLYEKYTSPEDAAKEKEAKDKEPKDKEPAKDKEPKDKDKEPKDPKAPATTPPPTTPKMRVRRRAR